jgi:hypothetical protein
MELVFAAFAFVFVKRLGDRTPAPISKEVGAYKAVVDKLRKREPMSKDEVDYAAQIIADRRSLLAYSIPCAIFTIGCFYVFGSLEQLHGATPRSRRRCYGTSVVCAELRAPYCPKGADGPD